MERLGKIDDQPKKAKSQSGAFESGKAPIGREPTPGSDETQLNTPNDLPSHAVLSQIKNTFESPTTPLYLPAMNSPKVKSLRSTQELQRALDPNTGCQPDTRELAKSHLELRAVICMRNAVTARHEGYSQICQEKLIAAFAMLETILEENPGSEAVTEIKKMLEEKDKSQDLIQRFDVFLQTIDARKKILDNLFNSKNVIEEKNKIDEEVVDQICWSVVVAFMDQINLQLLRDIAVRVSTISLNKKYKAEFISQIISKLYESAKDLVPLKKSTSNTDGYLAAAFDIVKSLLDLLAVKHTESTVHCLNMWKFSKFFVNFCQGVFEDFSKQKQLCMAAICHDIGKLAIEIEILTNKGKLSDDQRAIVEEHVTISYRIVSAIFGDNKQEEYVKTGVYDHHRDYNGGGYPRCNIDAKSANGHNISDIGIFVSIFDVFDSLTSSGRGYRKAIAPSEAVKRIRSLAGTKFDPAHVNLFIMAFNNGVFDDFLRGKEQSALQATNSGGIFERVDLIQIPDMKKELERHFGRLKRDII
ncbi:HD domain-containing protein [Patescibacteria group bacterium]|nr:HD domain-containing protein [Patescibacteria group bacterium]